MTSSLTITTRRDLTVRLAGTQSVVAVALLFAVNGLIIGGYGGVLPSIRERLGINATHIAIMLFTAGLAAIVAMQVGGLPVQVAQARVGRVGHQVLAAFVSRALAAGLLAPARSVVARAEPAHDAPRNLHRP